MSTGQKPKTKFALGDYVEVSERIAAWFEAYPDGRIETEIVTMTDKLVVTKSRCYRTQDTSELPAGIGHSMLGIPGKTPYTKDSELENCETSSVGRALVMAGIPSKSIASGHEIRNKQRGETEMPPQRATPATVNQIEAQTKQASKALAEPLDAERKAADDLQIVQLLTAVKTHAGYPDALNNLKEETRAAYKGGNGYVQQRIVNEVVPAIDAELAKLEQQPA